MCFHGGDSRHFSRTSIVSLDRAYSARCILIQNPIDCGQTPYSRAPGQTYSGSRECYYEASRMRASENAPSTHSGE